MEKDKSNKSNNYCYEDCSFFLKKKNQRSKFEFKSTFLINKSFSNKNRNSIPLESSVNLRNTKILTDKIQIEEPIKQKWSYIQKGLNLITQGHGLYRKIMSST